MKVLVYLLDKFQDLECVAAAAQMQRSGKFQLDYRSNRDGDIVGQYGLSRIAVTTLSTDELSSYDGMLLIGGQHCQALRNDPLFARVAEHFTTHTRPIFAICDGPNVLYQLGAIADDARYTSYPVEGVPTGPHRVDQPLVVDVIHRLITARDPEAAYGFGQAIVQLGMDL